MRRARSNRRSGVIPTFVKQLVFRFHSSSKPKSLSAHTRIWMGADTLLRLKFRQRSSANPADAKGSQHVQEWLIELAEKAEQAETLEQFLFQT